MMQSALSDMRISVVVPTHNRDGLLRQALSSVKAQSWPDWELVVVDDGSTPAVHRDPNDGIDRPVRWMRNEPAQGLSRARNCGIEAAAGDVITFLDDDDLLASDALERIVQTFEQFPDVDCLFINIVPFGAGGDGMRDNQARSLIGILKRMGLTAGNHGALVLGPKLFEAMLDGLPLAFQRVAIRRTAIQRIGLYQPGPFGDLEWNFRLALRCHCALILEPLYQVRCEGQSFFTRKDAEGKLAEAGVRINLQLDALPEVRAQPRLRAKVSRSLSRARFDKAYSSFKLGQSFPWGEFLRSAIAGFGWRHLSLFTRVCFATVRRARSPVE